MKRRLWDSKKLRILMEQREMTVNTIGLALSLSAPTVSAWRHGREPSQDQVAALAQLLHCRLGDFYSEVKV
jgi:transcriptional regulator with XRE-family HTH domain